MSAPRRKNRRFTPEQKFEIVMDALLGKRPTTEICREHRISKTLFYTWREQVLEGALGRLASAKLDGVETVELKKRVSELERVLGQKSLELEIAKKALRDWE